MFSSKFSTIPLLTLSNTKREIKQIAAEPFHLCARSTAWMTSQSTFELHFRPIFIREKDRLNTLPKLLIHAGLIAAVSSIWLLPYLISVAVVTVTFTHGLKYFLAILFCCCCIVGLTPLMLTKKNRHIARLYLSYFFTRSQKEETRLVIKKRLPVFQAVFFASILVCFGSSGSYIVYSYCGVDRETRNLLLKATIGNPYHFPVL